MEPNPAATELERSFILERQQPLSQSLLWQLQRNFFEQQGVLAWSQGVVPQYITSNPYIAFAYARIVFGFLRDCCAVSSDDPKPAFAPLDRSQPLYLIELGSGSGRFAFHFLKKFLDLLSRSSLKDVSFKYVMTDFAEGNLAYWRAHASFQPFVAQGILDFARFDAQQEQAEIKLINSGERLSAAAVSNPLIVVANYFFDSIPQDAFHVQHGQLSETLLTISAPEPAPDLSDPELLTRLHISYDNQLVKEDYYEDPNWNCILRDYQRRLADTSLLFPSAALKCILRFRQLSGDRLLLISADKGYMREEALLGRSAPQMSVHGSFSLMVNYHAIGHYMLQQGGQVLHTSRQQTNVNVCGFLLGSHPGGYLETRQAFRESLEPASPDDFWVLKKGIEKNQESLTLEQLLACLRLSGWDAKLFLDCFRALLNQIEPASALFRQEMYSAIQNVWDNYYHLGEERDLAFSMAMLLYGMQYYPEALEYFQHSLRLWGADPSTFYNMAMCHYSLRQLAPALKCVNQTLALDPTFEAAKAMRIKLQSEVRT